MLLHLMRLKMGQKFSYLLIRESAQFHSFFHNLMSYILKFQLLVCVLTFKHVTVIRYVLHILTFLIQIIFSSENCFNNNDFSKCVKALLLEDEQEELDKIVEFTYGRRK